MSHDKPSIIVIFGISGDLAQRKLLPALYHLFKDGLLHPDTRIVGLSRRNITVDDLLDNIELCVLETDNICDPEVIEQFRKNLQMIRFDLNDAKDYKALLHTLDEMDESFGVCTNRLFYLSIPPRVYEPVVRNLGEQGFAKGCKHQTATTHLLVEKPFGFDLASARKLIDITNEHFDESQIFRIDHYLAKGTAQNILTFRANNPLFQNIWNSKHISRIEIIAAESIGVEGRGSFYDDVGALRDLLQSHLLQLLALTTLELPKVFSEESLHAAKLQLLESIEPVPAEDMTGRVRRGQYEGYADEVQNKASTTETFASVELRILNERWKDTIVRLTTGKKLDRKETLVRLVFDKSDDPEQNTLSFRLQPNEGIDINLLVKKPGFERAVAPASLDYDYKEAAHPDAYERVLVDAIQGDHLLFPSSKEVIASWKVIQPVLDAWRKDSSDLILYPAGSPPDRV